MLKGKVIRDNKGYNVNLKWNGYGTMELYSILKIEGLDERIENMKVGEEIIINIK